MHLPPAFIKRYQPIAPDGFFEALEKGLPKTIRVNTLKTSVDDFRKRASKHHWQLTSLPWTKSGFLIDREDRSHPLGHSLEHFAGHIYIQEASSMVPPLVLDPRPGETVLDLAAAPGSKTTQLAAMMKNQGLLVANDSSVARLKALAANLERVGALNTVVTQLNGVRLGRFVPGYFDKVLLDAPCTAEGTIAKSPEALVRWSERAIHRLATLQSKLLAVTWQAVKPGGVLVYSTCTFAPEENELVVDQFLKAHPEATLEPFDLPGLRLTAGLTDWQGRTLHPSLAETKRIWPGQEAMEGFFIAKLRKDHQPIGGERRVFGDRRYGQALPDVGSWLADRLGLPASWDEALAWRSKDPEQWLMTPEAAEFSHLPAIRRGLRSARQVTKGYKPTTDFCQLFGSQMTSSLIECSAQETRTYLRGENLPRTHHPPGYVALRSGGIVFACGLAQADQVKNQLPVSRRILPSSRILKS